MQAVALIGEVSHHPQGDRDHGLADEDQIAETPVIDMTQGIITRTKVIVRPGIRSAMQPMIMGGEESHEDAEGQRAHDAAQSSRAN